ALGLGDYVELIGDHQSVEDVAADAATIPYEILAGLGHRLQRVYSTDATTAAMHIGASR
ncbi:MAG: alanine racemase C-terminal domain-containing protein, partial [Sphingomonadaceae bacterium]|nr:alanine racemase C-terminal domain-containing protein [Sphingomonadaceae bacterium]